MKFRLIRKFVLIGEFMGEVMEHIKVINRRIGALEDRFDWVLGVRVSDYIRIYHLICLDIVRDIITTSRYTIVIRVELL